MPHALLRRKTAPTWLLHNNASAERTHQRKLCAPPHSTAVGTIANAAGPDMRSLSDALNQLWQKEKENRTLSQTSVTHHSKSQYVFCFELPKASNARFGANVSRTTNQSLMTEAKSTV
eukprot:CAMPEP_0179418654 /NCGR_PEP_ID=MMETSP0799-20121207/8143_1 /TAXON_ID=46947 /ORGANISM="Geminigera cryophila, Strain CCMP2564" /LENGTH=117 /DNA_ID=CAMNT_0021191999 /DNA_START=45 /DNA_END=398 /DNA_ORIENTATION=+